MFKNLKTWWNGLCQIPFTEEQIKTNKDKKFLREYVRCCKLAASNGIGSDKQLTANQYKGLLVQGFVWSKVSHGKDEGMDCWYNRNTNNTKFLKDLTKTL